MNKRYSLFVFLCCAMLVCPLYTLANPNEFSPSWVCPDNSSSARFDYTTPVEPSAPPAEREVRGNVFFSDYGSSSFFNPNVSYENIYPSAPSEYQELFPHVPEAAPETTVVDKNIISQKSKVYALGFFIASVAPFKCVNMNNDDIANLFKLSFGSDDIDFDCLDKAEASIIDIIVNQKETWKSKAQKIIEACQGSNNSSSGFQELLFEDEKAALEYIKKTVFQTEIKPPSGEGNMVDFTAALQKVFLQDKALKDVILASPDKQIVFDQEKLTAEQKILIFRNAHTEFCRISSSLEKDLLDEDKKDLARLGECVDQSCPRGVCYLKFQKAYDSDSVVIGEGYPYSAFAALGKFNVLENFLNGLGSFCNEEENQESVKNFENMSVNNLCLQSKDALQGVLTAYCSEDWDMTQMFLEAVLRKGNSKIIETLWNESITSPGLDFQKLSGRKSQLENLKNPIIPATAEMKRDKEEELKIDVSIRKKFVETVFKEFNELRASRDQFSGGFDGNNINVRAQQVKDSYERICKLFAIEEEISNNSFAKYLVGTLRSWREKHPILSRVTLALPVLAGIAGCAYFWINKRAAVQDVICVSQPFSSFGWSLFSPLAETRKTAAVFGKKAELAIQL